MNEQAQASSRDDGVQLVTLAAYRNTEVLAQLEIRVYTASSAYDDSPWTEAGFDEQRPEKLTKSLIAIDSAKQPIGFLIASRRNPTQLHIHRLAVDPDYWRQGIARRLLSRFLTDAADSIPKQSVSVFSDPANASALGLYQAAGFHAVGSNADGKIELRLWASVNP